MEDATCDTGGRVSRAVGPEVLLETCITVIAYLALSLRFTMDDLIALEHVIVSAARATESTRDR